MQAKGGGDDDDDAATSLDIQLRLGLLTAEIESDLRALFRAIGSARANHWLQQEVWKGAERRGQRRAGRARSVAALANVDAKQAAVGRAADDELGGL